MKIILAWWYSFTLPQLGEETPLLRERMRYARWISGFALLVFILVIASSPAAISGGTVAPFVATGGVVLFQIVALIFNRLGLQTLAGLLSVFGIIFVFAYNTIAPQNMDFSQLATLNSMVIAILFAGALLPPIAILFVAAINCVIITLTIYFVPHTPDLTPVFTQGGALSIVVPPLVLQVVVAVVSFVIMRSLLATIRRADRAEDIAALQRSIAEHESARAEEKQQLEEGVRKLAQVHTQIANGNLDTRVALNEGSVLLAIAVPLNNLLSRMQRLKQDSDQYQRTQHMANQVVQYMQQARAQQMPLVFSQRTGTPLDPVLIEIVRMQQEYPSAPSQEESPYR